MAAVRIASVSAGRRGEHRTRASELSSVAKRQWQRGELGGGRVAAAFRYVLCGAEVAAVVDTGRCDALGWGGSVQDSLSLILMHLNMIVFLSQSSTGAKR